VYYTESKSLRGEIVIVVNKPKEMEDVIVIVVNKPKEVEDVIGVNVYAISLRSKCIYNLTKVCTLSSSHSALDFTSLPRLPWLKRSTMCDYIISAL